MSTRYLLSCMAVLCLFSVSLTASEAKSSKSVGFSVLADKRLEDPLNMLSTKFGDLTGAFIVISYLEEKTVNTLVMTKQADCDVVLCMPKDIKGATEVEKLAGAKTVAWKYPSQEPVWAAALTEKKEAMAFIEYLGGAEGHRLWSESKAGFTIVSHTNANAHEWVAENRTKHTYPMTAMRMLAECGGIRKGLCIDIGCGPGHLELELAKRSAFKIIGLDINPDAKPLFEKRMKKAGLSDRVSFVVGDAQKLPFPDDHADVIFSRGTLVFIPDIKKCLREVHRVLKPEGVAFLGGRYLYTPAMHKITTDKLREIVKASGVPGAQVIDAMGQWVKIIGPKAPKSAQRFQGGPHMLAGRIMVDYNLSGGKCLLICPNDGGLQHNLQKGLVEMSTFDITAIYPSDKIKEVAIKRIKAAKHGSRIRCMTGKLSALSFDAESFDLMVSVGPLFIFEKNKKKVLADIHRMLRPGGACLMGGRFLGMPDFRKVSSDALRKIAAETGLPAIRVHDNMGQWVEIRKGLAGGR